MARWTLALVLALTACEDSGSFEVVGDGLGSNLDGSGDPGGNPGSPFWWTVIFGANLGGNITPIGSASTLVAVTIIHKYKLPLGFAAFVKKAAPFAAVQILIAVAYVLLFLS